MSKILYIGPVRDFSGYATAARGYIRALMTAGADLVVRPVRYDQADPGTAYKPTPMEQALLSRDLDGVDVVIQHLTPNEMRIAPGKVNIAVVAWETDRIPQYWVDKLNQFDSVITFCRDSVKAFQNSGVKVPVHQIPHTFDMSSYSLDGVEPISSPSEPDLLSKRFVFYNISQFSAKKGIDVLLRAYLTEFHGQKDDVMLLLKTYINMGGNREHEREKLRLYIESVKQGMRLPNDGYPPIMLVTKTLSEDMMKRIHRTGNCYVCSSRGEGWCIPAFDALAYGNQLVTTLWGGMGEFAVNPDAGQIESYDEATRQVGFVSNERDNVYPVNFTMEPLVGQGHPDPELYTSRDKIAEPSVSSMMYAMRRAYDDRDNVKLVDSMTEFDYAVVGPRMLKVIETIVANKQETSNV